MTNVDEVIRLLEAHYCHDCGLNAGKKKDFSCDYCETVRDALRVARTLDPMEELRLKLHEDLAEAQKTFPAAVLCFEVTLAHGRVDTTYSIGRESRDQFAITVDGRGATLAQAIMNARQLPLPRQR
jgi:hypothetical protein